jgi:Fe-S cluster biogenesis protein NfuA/rhodanese-related sulfurtransferase
MQLSIEEFLKRRKESRPSYVFDLRSMDDYSAHHLSGAHNLPLEFMESNLHRLPFSGDLLFYDGGNGEAKQAAAVLFDNGFSDYFYVEEGLDALDKALANSEYDIKLTCSADDPKEVKMEAMQNLLDFEINPMVAAHGGHFSLLDVDGNKVYVELGGGCQGCGMVDVTLRQGVEKRMREVFPDMEALIDSTDHAGGENPYYQPSK